MKKLLLLVTVVSLIAFVGCKNKAPKKDLETKTEEVKEDVKKAVEDVKEDVKAAGFSSPEIAKGVEEWKGFMDEYTKAVESKNAAKIQELSTKAQEWQTKAQEWTSKMTPEDAKKWGEISKKYSEKLQAAMQN